MAINVKNFETAVDVASFFGGGCKEFIEYSEKKTARDFWTSCTDPSWITWIAARLSNTTEEKQIVIEKISGLLKNDDYIKTDVFLTQYLQVIDNLSLINIDQSYKDLNQFLHDNKKDGYVLDAYMSVRSFILGIKFELENKEWHLNLASCVKSLCLSKSKRTEESLDLVMQNMATELKTVFNFMNDVDI